MYSRLPNAVAELVANSYDADATHVDVVVDTSGTQSVLVKDDGHGMSPADLADKYLRIGRNRRVDDSGFSESAVTFAFYGVDGNGDRRAVITDD